MLQMARCVTDLNVCGSNYVTSISTNLSVNEYSTNATYSNSNAAEDFEIGSYLVTDEYDEASICMRKKIRKVEQ